MTGTEKTRFPLSNRSFKPERLGGSLVFRIPYLESRWVRMAFHTLILCSVAVLLLAAVTGQFANWQTGYRNQVMSEARASWSENLLAAQKAEEAGDLTGKAAALQGQMDAISQQLFFLPEDDSLRAAQDRVKESLALLSTDIAGRYQEAKTQYLAGDPLGALQSFQTVTGYKDADGWIKLSSGRVHRDIRRKNASGNTLTAWVQSYRLLSLMAPEKLESAPKSFAALSGVWLCSEDFRAALPADSGDGRAGDGAVRCLKAEGTKLYGGTGTSVPLDLETISFDTLLSAGGVQSAAGGNDSNSPDGSVLTFSEEGTVSEVSVLSENIIQIAEGGWKGTYYRVLEG